MAYKRILTVQDISCVGQCSLTVALPIISACGHETCILPSAVLSTHTAGFQNYTVLDLTEEFEKIIRHWQQEKIVFDAVYTGYICNCRQIEYVEEIIQTLLAPGGRVIVDPAMADGGKLYPGFDMSHVEGMRKLCSLADVILPNKTEACLLTGQELFEKYTPQKVKELTAALQAMGPDSVVLTGVGYREGETGTVVVQGGKMDYFEHELLPVKFHGTGDVYASAFTGAWMQGLSMVDSARIAGEFVLSSIRCTTDDPQHWYGVKFEKALPELIRSLEANR